MQVNALCAKKMTACNTVQIPNFALAAPTLVLSFAAVGSYFGHNPARFLSIGNLGTPRMRSYIHDLVNRARKDDLDDGSPPDSHVKAGYLKQDTGFFSDGSFVFVAQLAAMALFSALFMHIQVRTALV